MISKLNVFLLLCVAVLSMATLASDSSDYGPKSIIPFESRGRVITLSINPASDHVDHLESLLPLSLKFIAENAPKSSATKARWSLSIVNSDAPPIMGKFKSGEEWSDEGRRYTNLIAFTPPFCRADHPTDECIPCNLNEGCTLEVKVDVCEASRNGYYLVTHLALENRSELRKECKDEETTEQCEKFEEWMDSTDAPLEEILCVD
jgi:hypothetical protein